MGPGEVGDGLERGVSWGLGGLGGGKTDKRTTAVVVLVFVLLLLQLFAVSDSELKVRTGQYTKRNKTK